MLPVKSTLSLCMKVCDASTIMNLLLNIERGHSNFLYTTTNNPCKFQTCLCRSTMRTIIFVTEAHRELVWTIEMYNSKLLNISFSIDWSCYHCHRLFDVAIL